MLSHLKCSVVCILGSVAVMIDSLPRCQSQTVEWTRLLGSGSTDYGYAVSADGLGNSYLSGWTGGSLGGEASGARDAFVAKYDPGGNLQWTRQLGTSSQDESKGVSADGLGNVYFAGYTQGSLGGENAGDLDAFIAKYDAGGNLQWTRQLGSASSDESNAVSADGLGNVYLSGKTWGSLGGPNPGGSDAFVTKYDAGGNLQWTRQLGSASSDESNAVSADGLGNVYISGVTGGNLNGTSSGSSDAFVTKYDANGSLLWTRQFGTSSFDQSNAISTDGLGNVYLSGYTTGSLGGASAGTYDAFVTKYNAAGNLQWTRQLGTSSADWCHGVSADGSGNVYLSGYTQGSLGGTNAGSYDAFVAKYDASGALQWTRLFGTSLSDRCYAVSADGQGTLYFSGYTAGNFGVTNAGGFDAFVAKLMDSQPGDFNADGAVDGSDFLLWQRTLGSSEQLAADGDNSGTIDAGDLTVWQDHFGSAAPATTRTPEPSSGLLLCVAACAAHFVCRRLRPRRRSNAACRPHR